MVVESVVVYYGNQGLVSQKIHNFRLQARVGGTCIYFNQDDEFLATIDSNISLWMTLTL